MMPDDSARTGGSFSFWNEPESLGDLVLADKLICKTPLKGAAQSDRDASQPTMAVGVLPGCLPDASSTRRPGPAHALRDAAYRWWRRCRNA